MPLVAVVFAGALLLAAGCIGRVVRALPPSNVSCQAHAHTVLLVQWTLGDECDAFYLSVGQHKVNNGRPFYAIPTARLTSPGARQQSLAIPDLMPNSQYNITLVCHRMNSASFVWGWEKVSSPVECSTTTSETHVPWLRAAPEARQQHSQSALTQPFFNVRRTNGPSTATLAVAVTSQGRPGVENSCSHATPYALRVGNTRAWNHSMLFSLAEHCIGQSTTKHGASRYSDCLKVTTTALRNPGLRGFTPIGAPLPSAQQCEYVAHDVEPDSTYLIFLTIKDSGGQDLLVALEILRTATALNVAASSAGSSRSNSHIRRPQRAEPRYDQLYRISEYTFDIDFLENHNTADIDAMGPYLTHGTPVTTASHWPNSTAEMWNNCQGVLESACGDYRAQSFDCLECAQNHIDKVLPACGNFTFADNPDEGFAVHFFCGTGWPESVIMNSSIAQYCVESLPHEDIGISSETNGGFVQYASCNSDETDYLGNKPIDPICICWVYDDRIISHQNWSALHKDCDFDQREPYVDEVTCNCGPGGQTLMPDNPSSRFIGRSPVFLPYGYYLDKSPPKHYNVSFQCGNNYSTPRMGSCGLSGALNGSASGAPDNDSCTWRMLPVIRIIHGQDLLDNGYSTLQQNDTPANFTLSLHNRDAFKRTVAAVEKRLQPRCCGC